MAQQTPNLDEAMAYLRDLGIMFSLDDFGTGYSSLLRLQTLPVDELKIDRAFTAGLATGPAGVGIVRSTIDLAHALGIPAIAEGVETATEWDTLARLGCDGAQGWHIAEPMPAAQATPWLHEHVTIAVTANSGHHPHQQPPPEASPASATSGKRHSSGAGSPR